MNNIATTTYAYHERANTQSNHILSDSCTKTQCAEFTSIIDMYHTIPCVVDIRIFARAADQRVIWPSNKRIWEAH